MTFKRPAPRPAKQYDGANPGAPRPVVRLPVAPSAVALLERQPELIFEEAPAGATAAERDYMGRVAGLGCLLCRRLGHGRSAAEVHHVRAGQGGAQRAPNYLTLPLCPEHHRGATGIHGLGPRAFERRYRIDELGLLAETIRELCQ